MMSGNCVATGESVLWVVAGNNVCGFEILMLGW